jgi:anti-sigma factor RsiW
MPGDDAELVALIDNELDEEAKVSLLARLAADEALRQRYEALRDAGAPIAGSLDALLEMAPVNRLRGLPLTGAARGLFRPFSWISPRGLAAGLAACLLSAGAAAWITFSLPRLGAPPDWRSAVFDYTNLFTKETFSPLHPDASLAAKELSAVGERVGASLTPETVALPGLRFAVAFMLSYKGSPLGVIAYVDAEGSPVLLCVIADQAPDAPIRSERRDDLSLASWSRGGRSHLIIGRIPKERALAFARTLENRV